MAGPFQIQGSNFHFDIISLKRFIMNSIQPSRRITICLYLASFLLFACNEGNKEEKKVSDTVATGNQQQAERVLNDNEVKDEAPDANSKTEQGYALARHGTELAQSPIDIISGKLDKAGKEKFLFSFHSDFNAAENLGHTIQVDFKEGSVCTVNGRN